MGHFDLVEYRAARTMGEVDFFFKHQTRIVATRLDLPPAGLMPRIRKVIDRVLMKEKTI
jgi:hypothetical protein